MPTRSLVANSSASGGTGTTALGKSDAPIGKRRSNHRFRHCSSRCSEKRFWHRGSYMHRCHNNKKKLIFISFATVCMLHSYDTYGADAVLYRFNLHTRPAVDAPTLQPICKSGIVYDMAFWASLAVFVHCGCPNMGRSKCKWWSWCTSSIA